MSQQNKSTLQAAINTQLADNTSGDISAADVRDNMINMTDSLVFNEGTGQTITGGLTVTGGITGSLQGTATTASYVVTAQTASYVLNAVSASRAATASIADVATKLTITGAGGVGILYPTLVGISAGDLNISTKASNLFFTQTTSQLFATSISSSFTGSLQGTSSYATQALSASWAPSTGGSSFPFTGSAGISGSLVLDGILRQGQSTQTTGDYSRAYGDSSIAGGNYSHAEGNTTEATGQYSHAEGQFTLAAGNASHAEGAGTVANGSFSHAEGLGTVAQGMGQHAQGAYNISSSIAGAFILGNGSDDNTRSNLIFAAGNTVQITGSLDVNGSITGSLLGTATTASYVENAQTASYVIGTNVNGAVQQSDAVYIGNSSFLSSQNYPLLFSSAQNLNNYWGLEGDTSHLNYNPVTNTLTAVSISASAGFTGSLFGTSSYATTAATASYVAVNYTIYKVLLTFSGGTFTVTQLENTIGDGSNTSPADIQWSNPSNGQLRATKTNAFTSSNIFIRPGNFGSGTDTYFINGQKFNSNQLIFNITKYDGTQSSTPSFTSLPIEIQIYN